MKKLKQNLKALDENQKRLNELMASMFKKSTTRNERKEEQEVSTSEVSRNLYKEFAAVGDQHAAKSRENENQTNLEEDVGHQTLHEDCKVEEEQMVFEEKSVVSYDTSIGEFNIASSYHDKKSDCSSMNVDSYGSLLEAQDIREDMEFDPLLSGPATQELSLESNEGIYNSSLDWLPISYNRAANLLVGDLLQISNGDFKFGRSSTLFSHDDYDFIQDLGTCYNIEMGGVRVAQWEAMGDSFPTVWVHQIYHHCFGVELIQQVVLVLQKLFGDDWDIIQVFTWDPGGGE